MENKTGWVIPKANHNDLPDQQITEEIQNWDRSFGFLLSWISCILSSMKIEKKNSKSLLQNSLIVVIDVLQATTAAFAFGGGAKKILMTVSLPWMRL